MTTEQFLATLDDRQGIDSRRSAAKDAIRKLVMNEPLPVLGVNLIEAMIEHLKILGNYIERNYELEGEWGNQ
jgi:hypothetical protein